MVVIETPRLRLEYIEESDAPFLLELLNSPGWLQFIGDRNVNNISDARAYVNKMRSEYVTTDYGFHKIVVKESNAIIGTCGLLKRDHLEYVDIGFALLPAFYGKGYAFEAAEATLSYALNELNLNQVCAVTMTENYSSQRLLSKLGLIKIGTTKWDNGEELLLYLIDRDEL